MHALSPSLHITFCSDEVCNHQVYYYRNMYCIYNCILLSLSYDVLQRKPSTRINCVGTARMRHYLPLCVYNVHGCQYIIIYFYLCPQAVLHSLKPVTASPPYTCESSTFTSLLAGVYAPIHLCMQIRTYMSIYPIRLTCCLGQKPIFFYWLFSNGFPCRIINKLQWTNKTKKKRKKKEEIIAYPYLCCDSIHDNVSHSS